MSHTDLYMRIVGVAYPRVSSSPTLPPSFKTGVLVYYTVERGHNAVWGWLGEWASEWGTEDGRRLAWHKENPGQRFGAVWEGGRPRERETRREAASRGRRRGEGPRGGLLKIWADNATIFRRYIYYLRVHNIYAYNIYSGVVVRDGGYPLTWRAPLVCHKPSAFFVIFFFLYIHLFISLGIGVVVVGLVPGVLAAIPLLRWRRRRRRVSSY